MNTRVSCCPLVAFLVLWSVPGLGATLRVGQGLEYATIEEGLADAKPGDVVEVQGGQTYSGTINLRPEYGGTKDQPITVRGIPVNGKRPLLSGAGPGEWDNMVLLLNANHFIMESFEVVGEGNPDGNYCIVHKADDVILRDFVIHNCLHQGGLVGNDFDSGSLTLEYSELYHNGSGETSHQIYMATDEATYPNSVFRMQFCYVHDGLGGNNVKSRAERNEIYYNWIEGAYYHELDLIGPIDADSLPFREDSDIVGNVLIKKASEWRIARLGGDGSGNAAGRYRFANNTMVMTDSSTTVISLQETVETLEMYNNVIFGPNAGFDVYDVNEPIGPDAVHFGANNWVLTGSTSIPSAWTGTLEGSNPGWIDAANYDFRPAATSPLVDQGTTSTVSTGTQGFPSALLLPTYHPPQHLLLAIGQADGRNMQGAPDIGAFEVNASAPGAPPQPPPAETIGNANGGHGTSANGSSSGCSCRTPNAGSRTSFLGLIGALGTLALARARQRDT